LRHDLIDPALLLWRRNLEGEPVEETDRVVEVKEGVETDVLVGNEVDFLKSINPTLTTMGDPEGEFESVVEMAEVEFELVAEMKEVVVTVIGDVNVVVIDVWVALIEV